jgi:predicted nucleic acid-binding protein
MMPGEAPIPILIETSIWVLGQEDPQWFARVIAGERDLATCDAAMAEYEIGLYAPKQKPTRESVRKFLEAAVVPIVRYPHWPDDFREAARLIGEAIFNATAKPSFADGLIAACARRTNRVVWTTDETDFKAMGYRTFNPAKNEGRKMEAEK